MLTRRDLIHSRQFLHQRLVTSFVTHQPDPLEWTGRRLAGATLVSVMVLVIAVAAVGIYGFIRPAGNKQWRTCERIIIEAESGAPYVCGDGVLYPVENFTSAALLRGTSEKPIRVARASLTWPRGMTVGIPGAPSALPSARDLLTTPWSLCVRPSGRPGDRPQAVVLVGVTPSAGPGGPPAPLRADEALAVSDTSTGQLSVIHAGRRHEVRDRSTVSQALRINQVDTLPVSPAWLATVPTGPALGKLEITGRGGKVAGLGQLKVGQIVTVADGDRIRTFVARPTGVQPISKIQEALIRATADDTSPPVALNPVQLAGVTQLEPAPSLLGGDDPLPFMVPASRSRGVACAVSADGTDRRQITVGGLVPTRDPSAGALPAARSSAAGTPLADEVVVAPGRGVLVRAMATPTAADGTVYLVTETGWRYPVASSEALDRLGYQAVPAVPQPSTVVERLSQGPVLGVLTLATDGP
ncbi:type VII secretion protein EccB [Plantactinospora sonchi]|uniref:Type VII secretion protein EccB n=1 Tax=Plantactinospora sonchi TaxID=1544735 RepID=A0ABU7RQU6_9ACTN